MSIFSETPTKGDIFLVLGGWDTLQQEASAIRHTVFVLEQNVPVELENDALDAVCLHAVARNAAGVALATGRLLPDGHIGRMAVMKEARGSGIGALVLKALLQAALQRGDAVIALNAQWHAQAFYAAYGFVAEGAQFMDAGIPHIVMRYVSKT
ncbi:GNAT family N-acetyltransferase [Herbaspirillum sp. RTI4]|uniref:GNAT family N-acetyltransferase n=1 Tax=Herbaspirillum sp. RTI4 TaxID=3048640 RepID=UPI002AB36D4D|nr:GNAT family N-acetyltransferase [Herbaspirillum sp. RTI4]MDY7578998.1 GNAT family N-acetyltransferase [Herbaspirillum sp. RTI4]MEA9980929.1 GNAT family N-acetyltransferase [Herbaspirillum sp. RTI4]